MKHAMYCENGRRLAFVDPVTGQRSARVPDDDDNVLMRGLVDFQRSAYPLPNFCPDCGAKTLSKCHKCSSFIPYNTNVVHYRPNYCTVCSEAFPWTTTAIATAKQYTDQLNLSDDEKETLKSTFVELTRDTPKTQVAVSRFKKIYDALTPQVTTALRGTLQTVLTEGVQQLLHWKP
jgi:hypothetical protein